MDTEHALSFLRSHQPMPSDHAITDDEAATFIAILRYFEIERDERCLPLLINSVSSETGLGMYEHIKFVLLAHPREQVVPYLKQGLEDGNSGVLYRCCWWAFDIDAWELADLIQPLITHVDEDVRSAARAFVEARDENPAA
jgi:hypothetical protein